MTTGYTDLHHLQGDWRATYVEANGVANPPDEHGGQGGRSRFEGQRFFAYDAEDRLVLSGSFEIDEAEKVIQWADDIGADVGLVFPARYRLSGDHFVFIAGEHGDPAPQLFRTVPGQTLRAFGRIKHTTRD